MLYDITPDRHRALTTGPEEHTLLWDIPGGDAEPTATPLRWMDEPDVAKFSPDGKWLFLASSPLGRMLKPNAPAGDYSYFVVDLRKEGGADAPKRLKVPNHSERLKQVYFSPDAAWLLVVPDYPNDQPPRLYRLDAGRGTVEAVDLATKGASDRAAWRFSPDNRWLVSYLGTGPSRLWQLTENKARLEPLPLRSTSPSGDRFVHFSPDMKWLATYGYSDTARL